MKNKALSLLCVCMCQSVWSQPTEVGVSIVIDLGPHTRTWQWIDAAHETNTFVELQTGLNYDENGVWTESRELIERTPDGAAARYGQAKVYFPGNLKANWVEVDTADGKALRSQVRALAWYDASSGNSIVIGQVQDAAAQLVSSNQIVYANAFPIADVRYTYRKSGLEQDIILQHQLPPLPAGFSEANTRLWVITEFSTTAPPDIEARYLYRETNPAVRQQMASPDFIDDYLSFGWMVMGQGKAFDLADPNGSTAIGAVPIGKQWITETNGVTYLVEAVQYPNIKSLLAKLAAKADGQDRRAVAQVHPWKKMLAFLGKASPSQTDKTPVMVRRADAAHPATERGLVLDYVILNSATNFTFKGDTTYFVTNSVTLSQTTTIEGGTVVKFDSPSTAQISPQGAIVCQTGPYRLGVFTSKDDNSIGDTISGSTGTPSGYYGSGLDIAANNTLSNIRIANSYTALTIEANQTLTVQDSQIVNSQQAIYSRSANTVTLENVLAASLNSVVQSGGSVTVVGTHLTADSCSDIGSIPSGSQATSSITLTNSILSFCTNWGFTTFNTNQNQVAAPSSFGGVSLPAFQSRGAGKYYLAYNSPYRNIGATVNPGLQARLSRKTTYAPVFWPSSFSANTTLSSVVPRDTGAPDLGYNYDAIDYLFGNLSVTGGATLALTNGVTLGLYGTGLTIWNNSLLACTGTANERNHLCKYALVQEQPIILGSSAAFTMFSATGTSLPTVNLTFTDMPFGGGSTQNRIWPTSTMAKTFTMNECQTWNGYINETAYSSGIGINLMNNLFERCAFTWYQTTGSYYPFTLNMYNNLFQNGSETFNDNNTQTIWLAKDNLFDTVTMSQPGAYSLQNGHNGYYNTTKLYGSSGGDVTLYAVDYQTGPLGPTYYPTSGTNLYKLVDAGSRTASAASLTSYCTEVNQTPDSGTVDIGYHYYALNPNSTVTIQATTAVMTEGQSPNGTFTLTRTGSTSGTLTAYYSVSGTASNGVDYTDASTGSALSGSITFASGSSTATISITSSADGIVEYPETAILQLTPNSNYAVSVPDTATVTIKDGDAPTFTAIATGVSAPVAIDYSSTSSGLIFSLNYSFGTPNNFDMISSSDVVSTWSGVSGLTDEIKLVAVRSSANGFTAGDLYFGTGAAGVIGWLSASGTTSNLTWITLPGETHLLRGGLTIDQTGGFNGDMIVVAGDINGGGDIWRVTAAQGTNFVVNLNTNLEGVVTVTNSFSEYGPWAGDIVVGAEGQALLYSVTSGGATNSWNLSLVPEDIHVVDPSQQLYVVDFGANTVYKVTVNLLSNFAGDFVLTQENGGGSFGASNALFFVHWTGGYFVVREVDAGSSFEGVTLAPVNIP